MPDSFQAATEVFPRGWNWVINGWRLSVQYAAADTLHYDRCYREAVLDLSPHILKHPQETAEVAIWRDHKWPAAPSQAPGLSWPAQPPQSHNIEMLGIGPNGNEQAYDVPFNTIARLVGYLAEAERTEQDIIVWCHEHLG